MTFDTLTHPTNTPFPVTFSPIDSRNHLKPHNSIHHHTSHIPLLPVALIPHIMRIPWILEIPVLSEYLKTSKINAYWLIEMNTLLSNRPMRKKKANSPRPGARRPSRPLQIPQLDFISLIPPFFLHLKTRILVLQILYHS